MSRRFQEIKQCPEHGSSCIMYLGTLQSIHIELGDPWDPAAGGQGEGNPPVLMSAVGWGMERGELCFVLSLQLWLSAANTTWS